MTFKTIDQVAQSYSDAIAELHNSCDSLLAETNEKMTKMGGKTYIMMTYIIIYEILCCRM